MWGLNGPRRRKQPLHVIPMALALILAAFAGAAIGLIWQSSDLAADEEDTGQAEGQGTGDEGAAEDDDPSADGS